MGDSRDKLSYIKRAKPVIRDAAMYEAEVEVHPLIEKSARAISDWHSEADWPIHVDQAIRTIEVIAEHLSREGYKDAQAFLQSCVWRQPRNRVASTSKLAQI